MDQEQLRKYLDARLPEYLSLLRQMVEINSFTDNAPGVNEVGTFTAEAFAGLGFSAERVPSTKPGFGDHLVLVRRGSGPQKIGLVSHLDTVFPPEEEIANNFRWRVEGDYIYGPGTVDIKGGTVMILMVLEALKKFTPEIFEDCTWVILLNSSEERLSTDFGELCRARLAGAAACLVFEGGFYAHDATNFKLVVARKGMAHFRVRATGLGAHAGVSHPLGANAIRELAGAVQAIEGFTDYSQSITFNVGFIRGGTVTNRVPHEAVAELEMRAFDEDVFRRGAARVLGLAGEGVVQNEGGFRCKLAVDQLNETGPWPENPATNALFEIWRAAGMQLGFGVIPEARGGLSDGNLTWAAVPTLDGLGPGGGGAHQSEHDPQGGKTQEYIFVPSIVPKAMLNVLAIARLLAEYDSQSNPAANISLR